MLKTSHSTLNLKALTLIEIIVVIVIVGVLVSLAIPNFIYALERHRATEGEHLLLAMFAEEKRVLGDTGQYTAAFQQMGISIRPPTYFDFPTINTVAPPKYVEMKTQRKDGSYTLTVDVNGPLEGQVRCDCPIPPVCAKIGYDKGGCEN